MYFLFRSLSIVDLISRIANKFFHFAMEILCLFMILQHSPNMYMFPQKILVPVLVIFKYKKKWVFARPICI